MSNGPLSSAKARKAALNLEEFEIDRIHIQALLKLEYVCKTFEKRQAFDLLLVRDITLQEKAQKVQLKSTLNEKKYFVHKWREELRQRKKDNAQSLKAFQFYNDQLQLKAKLVIVQLKRALKDEAKQMKNYLNEKNQNLLRHMLLELKYHVKISTFIRK